MESLLRRSPLTLVLALAFLSCPSYLCVSAAPDQISEAPKAYRTITHLHTSFSHDSKFWSEPNLQLKNLKDKGYQVVLVSEHDHSNSSVQTDFFIPSFQNGGFEKGRPYPNQWIPIRLPRESAEYLNVSESSLHFEGNTSFHLRLKGNEDDFDLLSWAYWETGEDAIRDRAAVYNLWLSFSLYFPELTDSSDSLVYVSCTIGRRGDLRYREVSKGLCFYFSEELWEGRGFSDLSNSTEQVSIRLGSPFKEWQTYAINITDYALSLFDGLENVPTKYLFLKQVAVNLASRREVPAEIYADGFQIFSGWTSAEMYDWWRNDIESYSDDNFLVIAGLETTFMPDIGAYGLKSWHDFSGYHSVDERVKEIQKAGAISCTVNPRGSNFTAVREGKGWGAELLEIYNTVHDSKPSGQVLKAWDEFLSNGVPIFGVVGFDSHGLQAIPGLEQVTVVDEPIYENLIIARSLSRDDILSSLREGQMYVVRSDHPIRMSLSAGLNGPQQGAGIVFTSSETGAVLNIYLEKVPRGSELAIIQNGTRASVTNIVDDPFYWEFHLPMTSEAGYFRLEVLHEGDIIALSNPLFFRKTSLPQGIWLALDPALSSSTITSIQADNGEISVLLESPAKHSALLKIHCPSRPNLLTINGNDYTEYEAPTIQHVLERNDGWNYESTNQMLTLKLTTEGSANIIIRLPNQTLKDSKPTSLPLLEIGIVSAGLGLILLSIFYFHRKSLRYRGCRS